MRCEESTEALPPIQVEGRQTAPLSRPVLLLFATAAGLSVANIYCAQPLLEAIALEFGFGKSSVGSVITLTQIGYALGARSFSSVPLGDLLNRRRLVLCQLSFSVVALAVVYSSAFQGHVAHRDILCWASRRGRASPCCLCCQLGSS